jgi:hypothetical protein
MGIVYNTSVVRDGLVLHLDAANKKSYVGTGTAWNDLSGANNNGTLVNDPTYNSNNNGSFVLDGVDDRALINCNTSTIRTFNSTIQFAIKLPTYSGGQRAILSYRTGAGSLYIGKASNGIFCYYDQLLPSPAHTVGNITNDSIVICHVVCDATNNLLSTYVNGVLQGSVTKTNWNSAYHTTMYLGFDPGTSEYMVGNFYQFSHYNRVLSAIEISQNFSALRGRYGI